MKLCNAQSLISLISNSSAINPTVGLANATFGAWTTICAATPNDFAAFRLGEGTDTNINPCGTYNIGIGAAGSEKIIVPDVCAGARYQRELYFPISIPGGSRIAVQVRERTYEATYDGIALYGFVGFDAAFERHSGSGADALGVDQVNCDGTLLTAASTTFTKGAYSTLVASTAQDYMGLSVTVCQYGNSTESSVIGNGGRLFIDVAIGPAGSELVVIPDLIVFDAYGGWENGAWFFPLDVPAGTRVAARVASDNANATIGLMVHGVYK